MIHARRINRRLFGWHRYRGESIGSWGLRLGPAIAHVNLEHSMGETLLAVRLVVWVLDFEVHLWHPGAL